MGREQTGEGRVIDTPRWFTDTAEGHSERYAARFRSLAEEGADIEGEARLMDAVMAPGSLVMDAGCGQGRLAAALHRRGHRVVGVDIDPVLLAAAQVDHPGPDYVEADLTSLDLPALGYADTFDAIVCAGNVLTYVAPEAEVPTLRSLRRHLRQDGRCVVGFHTARYGVDDFDRDVAASGFALEQRFATWDLLPWHAGADFAVTFLRA